MRFPLALAILLLISACNKSPTGPTVGPDGFSQGPFPCTPPAGTTVHVLNVPGASAPFKVWLADITPPRGGTVRAGQRINWKYKRDGPSGYLVTVSASLTNGPGTNIIAGASGGTVSSGPCSPTEFGGPTEDFPATAVPPIYMRFRVWVQSGSIIGPSPIFNNVTPDYEAEEPIGWTIAQ